MDKYEIMKGQGKKSLIGWMKYLCAAFFILQSSFFILSCVDEEEFDNSSQGNFEALWKIIDEHYCFLDYKREAIGLDWAAVYNKYKVRVNDQMTNAQLFEVLSEMLAELRDGHVNLSATHDLGRYWAWQENFPANRSDSLLRRYLSTDYRISSGLSYRILDDNIGYVRYESFANDIGDGNVDEVLLHFLLCRGLIIDIRGNGGGNLTNADLLAARFCSEKTLVGYIQHKTGTGHNDFSALEECYIEPSSGIRWHKSVCLLTNRECYSAANQFTMYMKAMPNVTVVGDHTGGGAGMPFSNTLPNGWIVRFSAVPTYDTKKQSTEFGIAPDHYVSLTDADFRKGRDTIIEFARQLLTK